MKPKIGRYRQARHKRKKLTRGQESTVQHMLLDPRKIASASPKDEEAVWNYVHEQGWKSLYRHDRQLYRMLKDAAQKLVDRVDPRMKAARVRGQAVLAKLRAMEGGSISAAEAAKRLRVTLATLVRRYHAGRLIGWQEGGVLRFPVWQFAKFNDLLAGLPEVLELVNASPGKISDNQRLFIFLQ